MHSRIGSLVVLVGLGVAGAIGCGDDASDDGSSGSGASSAGGSGSGSETCEATFVVLQKDAYKETAGRSTSLWPPHTTTVLTMHCAEGDAAPVEVDRAVQANHGTEPDDVDANGNVFLEEMKSTTVSGSRDELSALLEAYRGCSCESATAFLSLDALQDDAVQELVAELVVYLEANLTCTGATDTQALVALLEQGAIEDVLAALPDCTWAGGTDLDQGLSGALETVLAQVGETLAGYHVCNNDAMLQAQLVAGFENGDGAVACDATTPTCSGPLWFYDP